MLERAQRAQASASMLLDPKILGVAMQAGRTLGWQRVIPVVLVGVLAALWLRESHKSGPDGSNEANQ
jgi:hypothetical protein